MTGVQTCALPIYDQVDRLIGGDAHVGQGDFVDQDGDVVCASDIVDGIGQRRVDEFQLRIVLQREEDAFLVGAVLVQVDRPPFGAAFGQPPPDRGGRIEHGRLIGERHVRQFDLVQHGEEYVGPEAAEPVVFVNLAGRFGP